MSEGTGDGTPLDPHPLVAALNPDPAKPPTKTVKLFGLPGESPVTGHSRLWLDSGLTSYVDIPNDAIRYHRVLPDDGGTIVWVDAEAPLNYGSVTSHQTQAKFLAGTITAAHLRAAAANTPPAAALPAPLIQSQQQLCGASGINQCVSQPGPVNLCPSPGPNCASVMAACPSQACPSQACPSQAICPEPTWVCPSHWAFCVQSAVACAVSHEFACQTDNVICPSNAGLGTCA